jgi:hypothetical protein
MELLPLELPPEWRTGDVSFQLPLRAGSIRHGVANESIANANAAMNRGVPPRADRSRFILDLLSFDSVIKVTTKRTRILEM